MENVQIIPSGITRPYVDWEQIVFYKAIYILVLVASGLILSFVNAYRKRDEADKLAFSIVLLSATFFGGAAITLGGAGYIERLPSAISPILVYSMVKYASSLKLREPRKVTSLLVAVPLIVLIFTGSAFYMSGRNFQSITYGEYYSTVFLVNKDPQNIMGIYSGLKVTSVRDVINAELENKSTSQITAISIDRYKITETYYYTYANMSLINASIRKLQQEMAVIYSNPDAVILLRNR
jgi:multisubunit Na+/H+ antiporter MnhB subunit